MTASAIQGYRLGDPTLARSPLSAADLAALKASLLFADEDVRTLPKAYGVVEDQVEAMHAAWSKSVLLQAILWSRPYVTSGDF